jgi:tetratricopeptide (TPR) repeat protein
MIMHEGLPSSEAATAGRQQYEAAHFLDLLGDSHQGLGHQEAAIEAYRQAAEGFRVQGAQCSYALCLFKVAASHLSLGEPWHAVGYLEACLPLLRDLGLKRHEELARQQLDVCHAELADAYLLGEGRAGQRPLAQRSRPAPRTLSLRALRLRIWPAGTLSPYSRDKGRFVLCPGSTHSRAG